MTTNVSQVISPEREARGTVEMERAMRTIMSDEPKQPEPEIRPPVPNQTPQPSPPKIPADKDAPQKDSPIRAADRRGPGNED